MNQKFINFWKSTQLTSYQVLHVYICVFHLRKQRGGVPEPNSWLSPGGHPSVLSPLSCISSPLAVGICWRQYHNLRKSGGRRGRLVPGERFEVLMGDSRGDKTRSSSLELPPSTSSSPSCSSPSSSSKGIGTTAYRRDNKTKEQWKLKARVY